MNGNDYALHLLEHGNVAVMPGSSFGDVLENWVRVALTIEDALFSEACDRIVAHANALALETA
jgi:arginine:pyruvate transaminase